MSQVIAIFTTYHSHDDGSGEEYTIDEAEFVDKKEKIPYFKSQNAKFYLVEGELTIPDVKTILKANKRKS